VSQALLTVALLGTLGLSSLGTPLRLDGYTFRPPAGFRMAPMDLYQGTRAGAIGPKHAPRALSAALTDGEGTGAATVLVALVEGSFSATPSARDDFATAAMVHFREELGSTLSLERAELIRGAAPRVEVLGTLKDHGQVRHVLTAAFEGDGRYAVITASIPSGRLEALAPALTASMDSFRQDPGGGVISRAVAGGAASLCVFALITSWVLWRRRQRLARADLGLPS
jgi:hypothetical protein